ncbi:protein-disulfide reductase DsbD family protein [Jannaschia seohaensis]|uniref:Suppressor for copper-sensitivity B n=1 Tax=Jannaschia seohaensis TaxID=475081 RepID=A0A2Y9B661_9RHOB|nr:protein-disulfide reductase DsbD domain-containing protein [Jannaschia seohaensis]PWJ10934.1 suppressor for copper-sensitivity B [Jannaschia seohaensis]SSA51535.1 suppressor for copper-sensitivity B [Jannaschia seohaensis]
MIRVLLLLLTFLAHPLLAATSATVETRTLTARVITASEGVGDGVSTLQAGLSLEMAPGWKTYWRSPGEVGLPPELSWEGSENVADVALAYPAPTRFTAFEIENFGYGGEVVFPLTVTLAEPGAAAHLALRADLLVCAELCIPETVEFELSLPAGGGVDAENAGVLAEWVARVPVGGAEAGIALEAAHLDDTALTVRLRSDRPFLDPDVFPEHRPYGAFGKPDIRLGEGGRVLWAALPVLGPGEGALDLTVVDGARAATLAAPLDAVAPAPPGQGAGLFWMLGLAFLGGLILNVMPCVLPVLSIKLASALQAQDRAPAQVRAGFLASAAGIVSFFALLAGALIGLQTVGVAVGWGVQFQSPVFLAAMTLLMTIFAANLLGFFQIGLPGFAMTGMARRAGREGLSGDFATGAFAAVMATPCSAPFVGTAVTYALTADPLRALGIFLAMGLGLAAPFLLVAGRPTLVRRLPRPGRWMKTLRLVLGAMLGAAALWLLTVLAGSAGPNVALAVGAAALATFGALALRRQAGLVSLGGLGLAALLAIAMPASEPGRDAATGLWQAFDRERIATEVAAGNVVVVDVTADWCLTCKVNKRLVLDAEPIYSRLMAPGMTALRADWTRADEDIAEFLRENGRFGIPFNAVYGPGAPQGIPLPEILTAGAVSEALDAAR